MTKTKLTPRILSKAWNLSLKEIQKILKHCNIYINDDDYLTKEQCEILKKQISTLRKKQNVQKEMDLKETTIVPKEETKILSNEIQKEETEKEETEKEETSNSPIRKVKDLSSQKDSIKQVEEQEDDEDEDADIPGINTFIKDNVSSAMEKFKKIWKKFSN